MTSPVKKVKIQHIVKTPRSANNDQISNRTSNSYSLKFEKEEQEFNEFLKAISSKNKKVLQPTIIKYFETLTGFIDLLSQLFPDYKVLLGPLLDNIEYEYYKKNSVLFKIDEIGEKFYIILKGKVKILSLTVKQYHLTKAEYLKHLIKLKFHDEKILLRKTLENSHNCKNYPLSEIDFVMIKPIPTAGEVKISYRSSSVGNQQEVLNKDAKDNKKDRIVNKALFEQIKSNMIDSNENGILVQPRNENKSSTKFVLDQKHYDEVFNQCSNFQQSIPYTKRLSVEHNYEEKYKENKFETKKIINQIENQAIRKKNALISSSSNIGKDKSSNKLPRKSLANISKTQQFYLRNLNPTQPSSTNKIQLIEKAINQVDEEEEFSATNITKNNQAQNDIIRNIENKRMIYYITEYIEVNSLSKGMSFGNLALEDSQGKRTATVLCTDDCYFATMNKTIYSNSLLEAHKRFINHNIFYLLRYNIFEDIKFKIFERKTYPKMIYKRIKKGVTLLKQNELVENIYFLKSGEYLIRYSGSLNNADSLIKLFGDKRNITSDEVFLKKNNKDFNIDCNKTHYFNIKIIKDFGYVGFDEFIYKGKCLFDVISVSREGEYFSIDKKVSNLY